MFRIGVAKLSFRCLIINILAFIDDMVSLATTQIFLYRAKAVSDNTEIKNVVILQLYSLKEEACHVDT